MGWHNASMTSSQLNLPVRRRFIDAKGFAFALLATAAATIVGWLVFHGPHLPDSSRQPHIADTNILMLYLLEVLWVATRSSRSAAILASILAVATFDFCFVPPYLTFGVADSQYLWTFAVMLITALVISTLTHRARAQAKAAREAWERAEAEFLRNTLLSGVSHDLRTPLSAITGAASTLIEAGQEEESRKLAEWHKQVFGAGNYFVELQSRAGLPEMAAINRELLNIAHELDLPVVASNVGGLPEVVDAGTTGVLVPNGSVEHTAAELLALLDDEGQRWALGQAGRLRQQRLFAQQREVSEFENLYMELVHAGPLTRSNVASCVADKPR